MAQIKDITTLCKKGHLQEGYDLAQADYTANPENRWAQIGLGWALYYLVKNDAEQRDANSMLAHLKELLLLNQLSAENDEILYDNLFWKVGDIVKHTRKEDFRFADQLFEVLREHTFPKSKGYSYLLKTMLGFAGWLNLGNFIEWWNLDNLTQDDYVPFTLENGKKTMTLAEQAYIGYAKALLAGNDREKMAAFEPRLEQIAESNPKMIYPGYFCGKMLLAMGADRESGLKAVLPFARKKKNEFWVWQLLSEFFTDKPDTQLACLLRGVHCRAQESFLVNMRRKLAEVYVNRQDFNRAKHHLDIAVKAYMQNGWPMPTALQDLVRDERLHNATADGTDGIDNRGLSDSVLSEGCHESFAIVTFHNSNLHRVAVVYGERQSTLINERLIKTPIKEGMLLRLRWLPTEHGINVVDCQQVSLDQIGDCSYIKAFDGVVGKYDDQPYAFVRGNQIRCFVAPNIVSRYNLKDRETVSVVATLGYNRQKDEWNWVCASINRK